MKIKIELQNHWKNQSKINWAVRFFSISFDRFEPNIWFLGIEFFNFEIIINFKFY